MSGDHEDDPPGKRRGAVMNRPSSRAAAWENWRRRRAGERVAIDAEPQCGFYKARRFGRWVGVQIDLVQHIDADGLLSEPERVVAWSGGRETDADEVWSWCAGRPIGADEFELLERMPAVHDLSRSVIV